MILLHTNHLQCGSNDQPENHRHNVVKYQTRDMNETLTNMEEEASICPSTTKNENVTGSASLLSRDEQPHLLELQATDVICSRNSLVHKHPGNLRYNVVIAMHHKAYQSPTATRSEKSRLTRLVLDIVQAYGGRFLKYEPDLKTYLEIDTTSRREKVSHALRTYNDIDRRRTKKSKPWLLIENNPVAPSETMNPLTLGEEETMISIGKEAKSRDHASLLSSIPLTVPPMSNSAESMTTKTARHQTREKTFGHTRFPQKTSCATSKTHNKMNPTTFGSSITGRSFANTWESKVTPYRTTTTCEPTTPDPRPMSVSHIGPYAHTPRSGTAWGTGDHYHALNVLGDRAGIMAMREKHKDYSNPRARHVDPVEAGIRLLQDGSAKGAPHPWPTSSAAAMPKSGECQSENERHRRHLSTVDLKEDRQNFSRRPSQVHYHQAFLPPEPARNPIVARNQYRASHTFMAVQSQPEVTRMPYQGNNSGLGRNLRHQEWKQSPLGRRQQPSSFSQERERHEAKEATAQQNHPHNERGQERTSHHRNHGDVMSDGEFKWDSM